LRANVSVIIPTWNRAQTLVQAIESVFAQTSRVLEILVCDDGSTDDTAAIVATIAARDRRVRWLPGPRGGRPAIPRNRGISVASGEWLAFLDSDDTWAPEKIEAQLAAAQNLRCGAVCSNAMRVFEDSEAGPLLVRRGARLNLGDLLRVNWVICSSSMVHASVLSQAGAFPEAADLKATEDYALWLRVATLTDFAYCDDLLVRYRDEPKSSIRGEQQLSAAAQKLRVLQDWQHWLTTTACAPKHRLRAALEVGKARIQIAAERYR
jgi:teichuronic acid biosynthesis glycosyltransferase TuaG